MKSKLLLLPLTILAFSCGNGNDKSDAYGNFESVEVLVGAEAQGKIIQFNIEEGQKLKKGQIVGYIDTLPLYLKKQQLLAQLESAKARAIQVKAQISVLEEQKKTILREQTRIKNLVSASAAPTKQLDDINGQLDVQNSQITSTETQNQSVAGEIKALQFQVAQVNDQINKSIIINPIDGSVLEKYVEPGEIAVQGKSLYKIADLSLLKLRVYISGAQLPNVKIGQKVSVFIDAGNDKSRTLEGTVSWISSQAEFTPKIIQTKDERVNLVYAVKIDVPNDGSLKIGMPGDVKF